MVPHVLRQRRRGWTLIEFAVVVLILAVLASFGVPRYVGSMERRRAAQVLAFLSAVVDAQKRYHDEHGAYAGNVIELALPDALPRYFEASPITPAPGKTLTDSWSLTLRRAGSPGRFGPYTLVFTQGGLDRDSSTACRIEGLLPPGG